MYIVLYKYFGSEDDTDDGSKGIKIFGNDEFWNTLIIVLSLSFGDLIY